MHEARWEGHVARVEYMVAFVKCIKFLEYLFSRMGWTGADFVPML